MTDINTPTEILEALDRGAVVALSMSGGKDSQAMASATLKWLETTQRTNRVVAIHADLGRAEWHDTDDVLRAQCERMGLELVVTQRTKGDLLQRIQDRAAQVGDSRPFWPSSAARYCTSDLKRDPIDKVLRTLGPLVISVEGVRAEESRARAAKPCWEPRKRITTQGREALTWRPIHEWSEGDVWSELGTTRAELQSRRWVYAEGDADTALLDWPAHPAYVKGNERLSCSLCILASRGDLENGARENPAYLAELVALEERYGWTFTADTSLTELAASLEG